MLLNELYPIFYKVRLNKVYYLRLSERLKHYPCRAKNFKLYNNASAPNRFSLLMEFDSVQMRAGIRAHTYGKICRGACSRTSVRPRSDPTSSVTTCVGEVWETTLLARGMAERMLAHPDYLAQRDSVKGGVFASLAPRRRLRPDDPLR